MADDEKKIIVDEDWKNQAQKEKEELSEKQHEEEAAEQAEASSAPRHAFIALDQPAKEAIANGAVTFPLCCWTTP